MLVLTLSTQASAADSYANLYDSNSPTGGISAMMQHVDDGDHFRVHDWHSDGHGVRGYLDVVDAVYGGYRRVHSSYNGKGAGTYTEFSYNVLEGKQYRMRVCTVDGLEDTTPVRCSADVVFHE
ncbi:hypothetical protein PV664_37110 [Streptomyces sp. ME01-18a]|uniref:hypothetical protein n=1 Tax=Streptomyces sp. ME01-18a TaxID=3028669 RepID=UPI0029B909B7|nr:hypothetical protein [Streptomyces sp. ME01-18a]MDX3434413.1 hypothetical protein [Streptomyces sp. ME01-18a]